MPTQITVFWVEQDREPMKAKVELWSIEPGFLRMELTADMRRPGVEFKELLIPEHRIHAIEVEDYVEQEPPPGYREENAFRETNGPWNKAMGTKGSQNG